MRTSRFSTYLLLTGAMTLGGMEGAQADVAVSNYNWLQLKPGRVTAFVGGASMNLRNPSITGYVEQAVRWSAKAWIPDTNINAVATADYWGGLQFDKARQVTNVAVELWFNSTTVGVRKFYVDGYPLTGPQAGTWVEIGNHDFGSMLTATDYRRQAVTVTTGEYQKIRVRFAAGDYQRDPTYAGPGIWGIEPIGNGTLADDEVNWANKPNFGTVASNNGLDYNGLGYVDGLFNDGDNSTRTGDNGSWESGDYAQIDLGQARRIGMAVIVPQSAHVPSTFKVQYSTDGTSYQAVTNTSPIIRHSVMPNNVVGGLVMSFDPVSARYWRITDLVVISTHTIFNEVLLFDQPTPEKQVDVIDYNWLQLKPQHCTASVGSSGTSGSTVTQYGNIDNFRWSRKMWAPHNHLTSSGASDYWAMLEFDEDRQVHRVSVDLWFQAADVGVRKFYIDGYPTQGAQANTWVELGAYDFGSMQVNQERRTVPVTLPGGTDRVRKLRVRFMAGDYLRNATYGGPGLWTIEPYGHGSVAPWDANWANTPNFATVPTVYGLDHAGTGYTDGVLSDGKTTRTGDNGSWESGDYAQFNLGVARQIGRAVLVWNSTWFAQSFAVQYSTDGVNYSYAANPQTVIHHCTDSDAQGRGAAELSFDPIVARYWRVVDLGGSQPYMIFDQAMLYGEPPPQPPRGTVILMR